MCDLSGRTAALWTEYQQAERERVRGLVLECLDRFIDALLNEDGNVRRTWALDLAASVADHGADTPVRFPLFRRVLLPILVEGALQHAPGCARWLAHFENLMFHAKDDRLPENMRTAVGLLEAALELDPGDSIARRRLVERDASYLDYTLHELPAGVLYGINGASMEQCSELLELLSRFKDHVGVLGEGDKYSSLVEDCGWHYRAYREYLMSARPAESYEEFLQRHSRSPHRGS